MADPEKFSAVYKDVVNEVMTPTRNKFNPIAVPENIKQCLQFSGAFIFGVISLALGSREFSFFFKGNSVLSPIAEVYHSANPFTGHHREYTLDDARYVVNEAGFRIVSEQTFNYSIDTGNLLERIKYAPALLLKEWAEIILLDCRKAK